LNPATFANPAINTFADLGAYAVHLPRWINLNASLVKSFYVHERFKFDLKFDMYNVANHLSISSVSTGSFNGVKMVNAFLSAIRPTGARRPPRLRRAPWKLRFA
jgi:hypothetical protein